MTFKSLILFNCSVAVFPPSSLVCCSQRFHLGGSSCLGFRIRSRRQFTPYGCWSVGFLFSFSWVVVLLSAVSMSQMIAKAEPE